MALAICSGVPILPSGTPEISVDAALPLLLLSAVRDQSRLDQIHSDVTSSEVSRGAAGEAS